MQAFGHRPGRKRRFLRLCGIAAAAVVALGLFLCVEYMRRPYCYIDGQAVYDKDVAMRTTVYLQGFSEFADPEHLVEELIVNDKMICQKKLFVFAGVVAPGLFTVAAQNADSVSFRRADGKPVTIETVDRDSLGIDTLRRIDTGRQRPGDPRDGGRDGSMVL